MNSDNHYLKNELYDLVKTDSSIFEFLQDCSLDGIWYWDLENIENEWLSPQFWKILGYDPAEKKHLASEWQDLIHADDLKITIDNFNKHCIDPSHPYDQIVRYRHKNGSTVWVRCRGLAIRNQTGKPIRMLGAHNELTQLKEAEEKYRLLFNMGVDAMFLVDNHTTQILECNNKASQLFGYSSQELLLMKMTDLSTTPEATSLACRQKASKQERVYQTKDGKLISVEVTSEHFHLGNRAVHIAAIRDITDKKKAENALENEQRFLTTVFDNIEAAIVICDDTGAITRFNEAARKLHSLPEQPVMPEQWSEYYNLFRKDGITPLPVEEIPLYRALQGELVRDAEMVVVPRNASPRYMICNGQKLADATGRIIGAVVAMHDDTQRRMAEIEREKLQTQLLQAQKIESVGRLAGGVAHDFNNMLGVILGHSELALMQTDENHDLHADLKAIQTAAQRSADITKQLLAFARKEIISPKQLDLNDTVENMLNMLRRLIGENIDLVWKPSAHIWPVRMDPAQIDQILANLSVNARDAISGVGRFTIETGRRTFKSVCTGHPEVIPGDYVLLTISDNGCGMNKDTLDNLFEPFFTTKEVGKGTGLGLATVYGIVKQNKGFINVYSEPGQGATFKIYLPRFYADEDTDKVVPEKKAATEGRETILLVEDEPSILRMTRMMLEKNGYRVLSAATPAEALKKAKNHSSAIDLLVTDVVMPEMNGRDLAEKIIALYPKIRLLFMSGYTAEIIANQGVLDDGVAFIQKPFSMTDLAERLRRILDTASGKTQQ